MTSGHIVLVAVPFPTIDHLFFHLPFKCLTNLYPPSNPMPSSLENFVGLPESATYQMMYHMIGIWKYFFIIIIFFFGGHISLFSIVFHTTWLLLFWLHHSLGTRGWGHAKLNAAVCVLFIHTDVIPDVCLSLLMTGQRCTSSFALLWFLCSLNLPSSWWLILFLTLYSLVGDNTYTIACLFEMCQNVW